jgi:hypothetical protein
MSSLEMSLSSRVFADELGQTLEGEGVVGNGVGVEIAPFCQPVPFYGIIQLHGGPRLAGALNGGIVSAIRADRAIYAP